MPAPVGLRVRKLADKTGEERVARFNPTTGERILLRPETASSLTLISDLEAARSEPWPLLGLQIEGETPRRCRVSTSFVERGVEEGWVEVEGEEFVHRPSGPAHSIWRTPPHTFRHADAFVLKCVEGEVRYRVARQPDKYVEGGADDPVTDEIYAAGETQVDHFYDLELEG